jgi:hypothetical protein
MVLLPAEVFQHLLIPTSCLLHGIGEHSQTFRLQRAGRLSVVISGLSQAVHGAFLPPEQ